MQEKQEVENMLADSALYEDSRKDDLKKTLEQQKDLAWQEGKLTKEWDLLSEKIESAQNTPAS